MKEEELEQTNKTKDTVDIILKLSQAIFFLTASYMVWEQACWYHIRNDAALYIKDLLERVGIFNEVEKSINTLREIIRQIGEEGRTRF